MIILRNNSHGEIVRKALPMYVVNWLENWKRWQVSNIRPDGIIFSKETGDTHWTTNCLRQLFVYPLVLFYWDWKKDTCVWARFLTGDTHCSCMRMDRGPHQNEAGRASWTTCLFSQYGWRWIFCCVVEISPQCSVFWRLFYRDMAWDRWRSPEEGGNSWL